MKSQEWALKERPGVHGHRGNATWGHRQLSASQEKMAYQKPPLAAPGP